MPGPVLATHAAFAGRGGCPRTSVLITNSVPAIRASNEIWIPTASPNDAPGVPSTFCASRSADAALKLAKRAPASGDRRRDRPPHPAVVPGFVVVTRHRTSARGIGHHESELGGVLREPTAGRRRGPVPVLPRRSRPVTEVQRRAELMLGMAGARARA